MTSAGGKITGLLRMNRMLSQRNLPTQMNSALRNLTMNIKGEVYTRVEELRDRTKELMDMTGVPDREEEAESGEKREEMSEIAELKSRVEELTKIQLGTDPIPEAPESAAVSIEEKREELMKAYLQSNPTHNR